jgi:hypothetical protein
MRRAAIYAGYSTDLQNDRSVEDQIELCKAHAARLGVAVVEEYSDRAKPGRRCLGGQGSRSLCKRQNVAILICSSPKHQIAYHATSRTWRPCTRH